MESQITQGEKDAKDIVDQQKEHKRVLSAHTPDPSKKKPYHCGFKKVYYNKERHAKYLEECAPYIN